MEEGSDLERAEISIFLRSLSWGNRYMLRGSLQSEKPAMLEYRWCSAALDSDSVVQNTHGAAVETSVINFLFIRLVSL